jgi:signal peptidase I
LLTTALGLTLVLSSATAAPARTPEADALFQRLGGQLGGTDRTGRLPQVYLARGLQELFGGEVSIVTWTGSMAPVLGYNDLTLVLPTKIENLKIGDIIVYRAPCDGRFLGACNGKFLFIMHRVIARDDAHTLHVKGDANMQEDPELVTPEVYVGQVKYAVQSDTAQIRDFTANPVGTLTTYRALAATNPERVPDERGTAIFAEH